LVLAGGLICVAGAILLIVVGAVIVLLGRGTTSKMTGPVRKSPVPPGMHLVPNARFGNDLRTVGQERHY
jgi:hypothetical protein